MTPTDDGNASVPERNWGGNYRYRASRLHRPRTIDDVIDLLRDTRRARVVGTRHTFTDIGDSVELISLADMDTDVRVDEDAMTVTVPGGATYTDVAVALRRYGLALGNTASLPHVSVAGAVATATHGSGRANGNLATAVAGLEMVTASGQVVRATRADRHFDGIVVSLGGLGVVTAVTLDVELDFDLEQHVFVDLPLEVVGASLDEVMATGHSVSVFTTFELGTGDVWVKRRVDGRDGSVRPAATFLGASAAAEQRHPVPGMPGDDCTPQLGEPGPWWDRLPHFRADAVPGTGDEIQSEFFVPRADGGAALAALRDHADGFGAALLTAEVRAVAADQLWMSPQFRRDSIAFHFTWRNDPALVDDAVATVEAALSPFDARPHWGKLFGSFDVAASYARLPQFLDLADRLDPHGVFRNDWWHRHIHP